MVKAVGYIRVSTDRQAESGLSLEDQRAKIQAMALVKGVELLDIIVDAGESAKDLDRPGVQQMMKMVRSKVIGMVIIAKLDRLTRRIRDACDLLDLFEKKGVALVSLAESLDTGSAMGRCIIAVVAAFSQMERELIAERTSAALQQKRRRGERTGTVPYGYRVATGGRVDEKGRLVELEVDDGEQWVLARARSLRDAGMSLREVAAQLNAEGYRTRAGGEWVFQYVANILRRQAVEA